jgi:toluene monooxygenase electron transfer component
VHADCQIKVRLKPQYVSAHVPAIRQCRYVRRRELTKDMAEYTFKSDAPAEFLPGQFALLALPGVVGDRAYSMSNLPNPEGEWSFIIKKVPGGRGTAVFDQSVCLGDVIVLDGPYGTAHFRPEHVRDIVCIGGGSGLSPLKSILSAAVREKALEGRRIHLFYGGRTPSDICVDTLLNEDALLKARVDVISACSSAEVGPDWAGKRGFIHDVLDDWIDKGAPNPATDYEFYFCGPPPMTDAVQRLLVLNRKVPMQQIHFDRFV